MKMQLLSLIIVISLAYGCESSKSGNNAEMTTEDGVLQDEGRNADERLDEADLNEQYDGDSFVKEAAVGGMLEVALGKLAQQKASSPAVKDFGERIVTDHSTANAKIETIAAEKDIDIPTSLPNDTQEKVDELSQLSGKEFDQQYMEMVIEEHEKDISAFEEASRSAQDVTIQDFASSTLPTLKEHHQMADSINQQLQNM